MAAAIRPLVAGNWKMNGVKAALNEITAIAAAVAAGGAARADVAICPPATLLAGAVLVIVGHSERRADHGESDADVLAKAAAALRAGLQAIVCVGETRAERESGRALEVVSRQVAGSVPIGASAAQLIVAYEPVWAIGTGLTPTAGDVAQMHAAIRAQLAHQLPAEGAKVRILYGGSVKPANAAELMAVPHVNGALVGGASLKAADFMGIAGVYR